MHRSFSATVSPRVRWPILLVALSVAACVSGQPSAPDIPDEGALTSAAASPSTNYFAYAIDPRIASRYGGPADVAWVDGGEGRRPGILVFGPQWVEFRPGVTSEELARFKADFHATRMDQQILPATPDGEIPAKPTDTYYVVFGTEAVSLEGLDAYAETVGYAGSLVFSSEEAAKQFYTYLRVRELGPQYSVERIGLGPMGCIPEDCGPDDGPVPSYPPVEPKPTPTPTPTPLLETNELAIKDFSCPPSIPLGKAAIIRVTGVHSDGCWTFNEAHMDPDADGFEVRLTATEKKVGITCSAAVHETTGEAMFVPTRPGVYTVIGTVVVRAGKREERRCEIIVNEE